MDSVCGRGISTFEKFFREPFSRFRLGQLLFILSVTFGLFSPENVRKLMVLAALLCLTRPQLKEKIFAGRTKDQKVTGAILLAYCAWALLVPLLFGIEPFALRLKGAFWFVEIFIVIWLTLLYAKDKFFLTNFSRFAIAASLIYCAFSFCYRIWSGDFFNLGNWPIIRMAWSVGTILCAVLPWLVYRFLEEKNLRRTVLLLAALLLMAVVISLTLYTTFWIVLAAQTLITFVLVLLADRRNLLKIVISAITIVLLALAVIHGVSQNSRSLSKGLSVQFRQLSLKKFDADRFTNKRYSIWKDSVRLIKARPLTGYGRTEFKKLSVTKNPHTHNGFLEAAFTAGVPCALLLVLLLLHLAYRGLKSLASMTKNRRLMLIPFVVINVLAAFVLCCMVDDMFLPKRAVAAIYAMTFTLTLTPLAKSGEKERED